MGNNAKIRINLNLREFEIEGSEDFINSHVKKIESFLEILKTAPPVAQPIVVQQPATINHTSNPVHKPATNGATPETFGEYLHLYPKTINNGDKLLAAGQFAQSKSTDAAFSTSDATALLLEQGIKLSNPAVFIKGLTDGKKIIKLSKNKFKVSADGIEHLNQIATTAN